MIPIIQQLINGLVIGAIFSLIALGLTMIYGVLRVLHFAHGAVYMLGAYFGFVLLSTYTNNIWISLLISSILTGILGILISVLIYNPIIKAKTHPIAPLIAGLGAYMVLSELARIIWGPYTRSFSIGFPLINFNLGAFSLSFGQLSILLITISIIIILHFFLKYTKLGLSIRAVSQDPDTSSIYGVNVNAVIYLTFFVGSAFAGLAGLLVGIYYNSIYPSMGLSPLSVAFAVIIIGGMGSILGSILGGFLLGIISTILFVYLNLPLSSYGYIFLILILFLIFRPTGLFGKEEEVRA
ncbi:MAG: branched-chain amino acid ABC transporter permease [Thermoplasmata archaeon]|jgi:branched-chain amino acid transport system permease protein|uniref:branched-chain amino acid ABC transporter permease n=1 Tax=Caldisericum sp. TaxID=2499687 RepID=UPI003CBACE84